MVHFIHIADCHLGSFREDKLRQISMDSFIQVIDTAISRDVDFILIAGDLFNTALPSIEVLTQTISQLKKLKEKNIPVYFIAGSHDYSAAGKTMLSVLEETDLAINVLKGDIVENKLQLQYITDEKTGIHLCGILGRAQALEKSYYELLDHEHLAKVTGTKIFLFHSAITEYKPDKLKDSPSTALSFLPKGFTYYAGGHVHMRFNEQVGTHGKIVYPGPTFPNSFSEIEELECGSFAYTQINDGNVETVIEKIKRKNYQNITLSVKGKTPTQIEEELESITIIPDSIITLRLKGKLYSGSLLDINLTKIIQQWMNQGAYIILKNTLSVESEQFTEELVHMDTEQLEEKIINEHLGKISIDGNEKEIIIQLMKGLLTSKQDGETANDFEKRVIGGYHEIFN